MMSSLLLKELHEHFLSLRLQVGFLLALLLVSASAFVLSSDYRRRTEEFYQQQSQEEEFASKYAHLNRIGWIEHRRLPPPLVLVRGVSDDAGRETLNGNPMEELFLPTDFAGVAAFIFSLFGIVLGFDSLNGERERGTLRLVLANRLRRFDLLAAKWLAGILVLSLMLLASLIVAAAVVLGISGVNWGGTEWLSLAALYAVVLLYSGIFFALALLLSATLRRSAVSVLASVFGWVLMVLVIPNASPYVAAQFVRLPSVAAVERDVAYLTDWERDELGRARSREIREKYLKLYNLADPDPAEHERRMASDPVYKKLWEQRRDEIDAGWAEVNRQQGAKAERVYEVYRARAQRQLVLSQKLSNASPLAPMLYAATELADTGFGAQRRLAAQISTFRQSMWRPYLKRRHREELQKNPAFSVNDFLDIRTRPRFTYSAPPLSERLSAADTHLVLLAGWNLALFVGAVLVFQRFDVR
jgi:ABC-type transport system involved in multi-copper enzyme maturation permease subunit